LVKCQKRKCLTFAMINNITLITPAQKVLEWVKDDFGMEVSFCVGG